MLTRGYRYLIIYLIMFVLNNSFILAKTTWIKTYGGNEVDCGYDVKTTLDGGYIIVGSTYSFGKGNSDVYLIKINMDGDTLWTRNYGGNGYDVGFSVHQTADEGFIITGETRSFGKGENDVYLIKTNEIGDTIWTKSFGNIYNDYCRSSLQNDDGGLILLGNQIIKTNSKGDTIWTKHIDGFYGFSIWNTVHGDYVITGEKDGNMYFMKIDSSGNALVFKYLLKKGHSVGKSIQETSDGCYIITGSTNYPRGYETDSHVCLVKVNSSGDTLWTRNVGEMTNYSGGNSVKQTKDGGYIIAGFTNSCYPPIYLYLIKTNSFGDTLWSKTYGRYNGDEGFSVININENGYVITGRMNNDVCLIKTDEIGNITGIKNKRIQQKESPTYKILQSYPNPFNQSTEIFYEIKSKICSVKIVISNISGKEVKILIDGKKEPGTHHILWDGKDNNGCGIPSGIYICTIILDNRDFKETIKLSLIR